MKKSMEDCFRTKMIKSGKKSKLCPICAIPVRMAGAAGRVVSRIRQNGKRLAVLGVIFLLFAVYSSFSFPGFMVNGGDGYGLNAISEEAQGIEMAEETAVDLSMINNLIDEDAMLEGKYYVGISQGTDAESVPVSGRVQSQGDLAQTQIVSEQRGDVPEFSPDGWRLILANQQHSLPDDYKVELGDVHTLKGMLYCDARIVDDWLAMQEAAKEDGISLVICSPYRDLEYQRKLFNGLIKKYTGMGVSYMEAYQLTSQAVAVPNTSEHQMGIAFDIVTPSYTSLDEGFADTEAGKWLAENSCDYGFILRYPKGKEFITGIEYEPWHFRYVGVEAAGLITKEGITLEEFWEEYM